MGRSLFTKNDQVAKSNLQARKKSRVQLLPSESRPRRRLVGWQCPPQSWKWFFWSKNQKPHGQQFRWPMGIRKGLPSIDGHHEHQTVHLLITFNDIYIYIPFMGSPPVMIDWIYIRLLSINNHEHWFESTLQPWLDWRYNWWEWFCSPHSVPWPDGLLAVHWLPSGTCSPQQLVETFSSQQIKTKYSRYIWSSQSRSL